MNRHERRKADKLAGIAARDRRAAADAEKVALQLSPMEARQVLARWAAKGGHLQAEVDALNGRALPADVEMAVYAIFTANCGMGARYLRSELSKRGEHNTIAVQFEMIPEGRQFNLDGVIRGEGDEALRAAVLKIADIAANIRDHIKPDSERVGRC